MLPEALATWVRGAHDRSAELLPGDLVRLRRGSSTLTLRIVDAVAFASQACGRSEPQQLRSPDRAIMRERD